jgi:hypothetical protein
MAPGTGIAADKRWDGSDQRTIGRLAPIPELEPDGAGDDDQRRDQCSRPDLALGKKSERAIAG